MRVGLRARVRRRARLRLRLRLRLRARARARVEVRVEVRVSGQCQRHATTCDASTLTLTSPWRREPRPSLLLRQWGSADLLE
jgi:hypothetical protein